MANLLCLDSEDPEIGDNKLLQIVCGKYLPIYTSSQYYRLGYDVI
jgi:hypothetical protein